MRLFIGTTFYSSLILPKAPGTVSSFLVYLLFVFLSPLLWQKIVLLILFVVLHFICFSFFERKYRMIDPSTYTLDESIAMVLLNIPFHSKSEWIAAFLIFRFFDILKPLGIRKFERIDSIPTAVRNIGDDIIAAIYTYLIITGFLYVL